MKRNSKKKFGKKLLFGIVILFLFLIVGVSYMALPMEGKVKAHIDFGLSNGWHIFIGCMILLMGILMFVLSVTTEMITHVNKLGAKYWFVFILFDVAKYIVIVVGAFLILGGSYGVANTFIP